MNLLKQTKKKNKYRKNKKLLSYCEQFKTIEDFKQFIIEEKKTPDYIAIDNVPFTMEEYDMDGQTIIYMNKKLMVQIEVEHTNRYKDFSDVKSIILDEASCWRNDITFLE